MSTHIVQKGDTLWKIAKQHGIGFEELKRMNAQLANPDYIVPGMEVRLPEQLRESTSRKMQPTQPTQPMQEEMPQWRPHPEFSYMAEAEDMMMPQQWHHQMMMPMWCVPMMPMSMCPPMPMDGCGQQMPMQQMPMPCGQKDQQMTQYYEQMRQMQQPPFQQPQPYMPPWQ